MICHRLRLRLACVVLVLLTAGLFSPAALHARPSGEERAFVEAEPAGLVDVLWRWLAHHLMVGHFGEEGWGMDPNGGK
jgi:hypothetical protein